MRALEDLRSEPLVGEVSYLIDDETIHPLLFHDYARTAYYLTLRALESFEEADAIGPGPYVVPSVAFWFMASESYISTIYKACRGLERALVADGWTPPFGALRDTGRVVEKAAAIKEWIAGASPPTAPTQRLHEFATFRNKLFHDLTEASPRTVYSHTLFSPRAEKNNQVDLMEALNVSLETFGYFRYVFAIADLMPSIMIGATSEKLDVLVEEVVWPAFTEVLAAKDLSTAIEPPAIYACPAELRAGMQFLIRSEGPTAPRRAAADGPCAATRRMQQAIQARPVDDTVFKPPNYVRQASASVRSGGQEQSPG